MKICRRLAIVRREVVRLAAIATARAAEAESPRATLRFEPLCEAEAEAIVSADVLATLALRRPTSLAM